MARSPVRDGNGYALGAQSLPGRRSSLFALGGTYVTVGWPGPADGRGRPGLAGVGSYECDFGVVLCTPTSHSWNGTAPILSAEDVRLRASWPPAGRGSVACRGPQLALDLAAVAARRAACGAPPGVPQPITTADVPRRRPVRAGDQGVTPP